MAVVFSGRCRGWVWVEEWFWEVGSVAGVLKFGWVHCVAVVLRIGRLYCVAVVNMCFFSPSCMFCVMVMMSVFGTE